MRRRQGYNNIHDLFLSLLHGNTTNIDSFIQNGGSKELTGPKGITFLIGCIEEDYEEKFHHFLSTGCSVNKTDSDKKTPLYHTVGNGRHEYMQELLERGCDVNLCDESGVTPLILAARQNDFRAVSILVEHGCSLNCRDSEYGRTALHEAVRNRSKNLVHCLIQNGADLNIESRDHSSPVTDAVKEKKKDILLEILAYVSEKSIKGCLEKPLKAACEMKYIVGAELLLANGANPFYNINETCATRVLIKDLEDTWTIVHAFLDGREVIIESIIKNYGLATSWSRENQLLQVLCDEHGLHNFEVRVTVEMLVLCGLQIQPQSDLLSCFPLCGCRQELYRMQLQLSAPVPGQLTILTRNAIRANLGFGALAKVNKLPLPKKLKQFVSLKKEFLSQEMKYLYYA